MIGFSLCTRNWFCKIEYRSNLKLTVVLSSSREDLHLLLPGAWAVLTAWESLSPMLRISWLKAIFQPPWRSFCFSFTLNVWPSKSKENDQTPFLWLSPDPSSWSLLLLVCWKHSLASQLPHLESEMFTEDAGGGEVEREWPQISDSPSQAPILFHILCWYLFTILVEFPFPKYRICPVFSFPLYWRVA